MRITRRELFAATKREAANSFGSDEILLEKYFTSCRHIEVQIFGDHSGNVVAFGERDCSVQRRFAIRRFFFMSSRR